MDSWFEHSFQRPDDTIVQVRARLERLVDDLALDYFSYGMPRAPGDGAADADATVLSSYPREWNDRYIERSYIRIDPVCRVAATSTRPFFWGHGGFLRAFRRRQRLVFDEARAFGIMCGLSIPVRCARGATGIFNVIASDEKRLKESTRHEHERLFAAAYDLHDFMLGAPAVLPGDCAAEPCLSRRERDCLLWTLEGKTAEQVAVILGLSVFTVNRYASNAARKLGCASKHHAAVRALRAGLI